MPTFYNFRENGVDYSFDDIFVPADAFRQGNLWIWGRNSSGALGINSSQTWSNTPVTTSSGGVNWKQVDVSFGYAAAIKTDGTLWTWGYGKYGVNGNAQTTDRSTPVTTFAGGTNWRQTTIGAAIKTDGTLWVWGNSYRLGINASGIRSTPVTTFAGGTNWKRVISPGNGSVYATKTDGTLWVWGNNNAGQLGINNTINMSTPVTTFAGGNNWKQVNSGGIFSGSGIAGGVKEDGTLWVWGPGSNGKLGTNDTISRLTPVTTFAGGNNWKEFASGGYASGAIKNNGTLWIWGGAGTIGINVTSGGTRLTPVTTFAGGTNWKTIEAGFRHFASIKGDGTLWTWGTNTSDGELGNNLSPQNAATPITTFIGGSNWKQVSATWTMTSAVTYDDPAI